VMSAATLPRKLKIILKTTGAVLVLALAGVLIWGVTDGDEMLSHIGDDEAVRGVIRINGFDRSWKELKDSRIVKMILKKNDISEDVTERDIFWGWTTATVINAFGKDVLYIRFGDDEVFLLKIGILTKIAEPFSQKSARVKEKEVNGLEVKVLLEEGGKERFYYRRLGRTVIFSESAEALVRVCRTETEKSPAGRTLASLDKKHMGAFFRSGDDFAEFLLRIGIKFSRRREALALLEDTGPVTLESTLGREMRGSLQVHIGEGVSQRYPFVRQWKKSSFESLEFVPANCLASLSFDAGRPLADSMAALKEDKNFSSRYEKFEENFFDILNLGNVTRRFVKDELTVTLVSLRPSSESIEPGLAAVVEGDLEDIVQIVQFSIDVISKGKTRLREKKFKGRDVYYIDGKGKRGEFSYCPLEGLGLFTERLDEMEAILTALDKKETLATLKNTDSVRGKGNIFAYLNCKRISENFPAVQKYLLQENIVSGQAAEEYLEEIYDGVSLLSFACANVWVEKDNARCEFALDLR